MSQIHSMDLLVCICACMHTRRTMLAHIFLTKLFDLHVELLSVTNSLYIFIGFCTQLHNTHTHTQTAPCTRPKTNTLEHIKLHFLLVEICFPSSFFPTGEVTLTESGQPFAAVWACTDISWNQHTRDAFKAGMRIYKAGIKS